MQFRPTTQTVQIYRSIPGNGKIPALYPGNNSVIRKDLFYLTINFHQISSPSLDISTIKSCNNERILGPGQSTGRVITEHKVYSLQLLPVIDKEENATIRSRSSSGNFCLFIYFYLCFFSCILHTSIRVFVCPGLCV